MNDVKLPEKSEPQPTPLHQVSDDALTIAVVGLGYVGLPLAIAFGQTFATIGFDLSEEKINRYADADDVTGEVSKEEFQGAAHLSFTTDSSRLAVADVIIVAVPTPVDEAHLPDFSPLLS